MQEYTEEDMESIRHRDFKLKKHEKGCTCGYCWLKKMDNKK